jgi:hypothetical protein
MDNIIQKVEHALVAALIVVSAFLMHKFSTERSLKEQALLAAKGLPPDVLAQYTYQNNMLTELIKNSKGKTEVVAKYVASESEVTVITKERDEATKKYQDLLEQLKTAKNPAEVKKIDAELKTVSDSLNKPPEISAPTWGFTSRFGIGMVVSPGHSLTYAVSDGTTFKLPISPVFDWKYFYWDRYSALLQVNAFYGGPEFSRHVDDVTPKWMHMNNTEFSTSFGPGWTGGYAGGVGLRTNW